MKQSGGLFRKRGALCKRERPSESTPDTHIFCFLDYLLGLSVQDDWNRNIWEVVLISLCSAQRKNMEFRKRSIDFGVKPFKKGLVGFKRAKPFVCTINRYSLFFTTSEVFLFKLSCAARPKM